MSRKGDCWDNAVAASFFHTLKTELIYLEAYDTHEEAPTGICEYIEVFYNRQRCHSANGYLAPLAYEQALKTSEIFEISQIPVDSFTETSGGGTMVSQASNRYDSSLATTSQRSPDEVYQTPRFSAPDPD